MDSVEFRAAFEIGSRSLSAVQLAAVRFELMALLSFLVGFLLESDHDLKGKLTFLDCAIRARSAHIYNLMMRLGWMAISEDRLSFQKLHDDRVIDYDGNGSTLSRGDRVMSACVICAKRLHVLIHPAMGPIHERPAGISTILLVDKANEMRQLLGSVLRAVANATDA